MLRKAIQTVASDLPRFVQVAMRALPQVSPLLADDRIRTARNALFKAYLVDVEDAPDLAEMEDQVVRIAKKKLDKVLGEVMRERYDSLQLFDTAISKMVEGLANYLADLLIRGDKGTFEGFSSLAHKYLGFPLQDLFGVEAAGVNAQNFRRDYLAIFLKYYLMAVVVNYPTMKQGQLDATEELLFIDAASTMFAEVKPLPLPDRAQEIIGDVAGKISKVGNVLRSKQALPPPAPVQLKSRVSRFFSSIASIVALVCKTAFRVLCKGVGALRNLRW